MTELEVNGKTVDKSEQDIAITRQVINAENPLFRNIDITNKFKLPFTAANKDIFGFPSVLNSDNEALYKNYPTKIIDQTPIFNGVGFIKSYGKAFFDFQLADKSKELFDNLRDEIKSIGFDDQDILFNQAAYDLLKLPSDDRLWVWPIVSMHEDGTEIKSRFTSGNDGLKYSRPFFNYKYIIDKVINGQNWTYENNEDLNEFLCLSSNHSKFYITSYQKALSDSFVLSGTDDLTDLDNPDFNKGNTLASTTIGIGGTKTQFRLRGNVTSDNLVTIQIKGTESVTLRETIQEFKISSSQIYIDFTSKQFSSSSNSVTINITISGDGNFKFEDTLLYTIIEENNKGDLSTNPLLDYKVKAHDNLLTISQLDLFKISAIMTNSIYKPDSFEKHIEIKTLKDLSKLNSVDWSEKFDQKSEVVENRLNNLGQINNLLYDNDSIIDENTGKDTFTVTNEALEDVKDFLTLPFSASNDIDINNYSIGDFDIYSDTKRENTLNPRILYFYNDPTNQFTLARFLEIDWRNLHLSFYKNWLASFERVKIIKGSADLNKLDVLGFDFTKLVYIEYFKSYFFVHAIEDYIAGRKTKVELIKFL